MAATIFSLSALLFWIFALMRLYLLKYESAQTESLISIAEKLGYIFFTLGLALYIFFYRDHQNASWATTSIAEKKPLSWLLFVWCVYSAQIITEIFYQNTFSQLFTNAWAAASLSVIPQSGAQKLREIFSSDELWLSLHRMALLLGYAFCFLALPYALNFLFSYFRAEKIQIPRQSKMWTLDRMQYRLILWALPLLTFGIVAESVYLLEAGRLPSPADIWWKEKDIFLALMAWLLCGVYLHSRMFFSWRDMKSTFLYLAGFALLVATKWSPATIWLAAR